MEFTLHAIDVFGLVFAGFAVGIMLGHTLGKMSA